MSKVLWHTINIQIPDKMINVSKTGKMTIKQSLTKKGIISKSNHEPSVIIKSSSSIDKPIIKDSGKFENIDAIKLRQKKLKAIKERLAKLPTKPKTTKDEFIKKAKAKVAPHLTKMKEKRIKELEDEVLTHYKKYGQLTSSQSKAMVKKYKQYIPKHKYYNDVTEDYQHLLDIIRKKTGTIPVGFHDD